MASKAQPKTAALPDAPDAPDAPGVPEADRAVAGYLPVHVLTLRAIDPVRADGVDYAPGDAFELDALAADSLLASGAAELA